MAFYARWRFTVLLTWLLLVLGGRMAASSNRVEQIFLDLCGAALIVAAMLTICSHRRFRVAALILGIPPIFLGVVGHVFPSRMGANAILFGRGTSVIFLAFTILLLVRAVVKAREITWDAVMGAIAGYVLIGVIWTELYCVVELMVPGSFAAGNDSVKDLSDPVQRQSVLEYFSFATLSTLGYGDLAPLSRPARSLACLEAICGQFYLAVLVAGLIGMRGATPAAAREVS